MLPYFVDMIVKTRRRGVLVVSPSTAEGFRDWCLHHKIPAIHVMLFLDRFSQKGNFWLAYDYMKKSDTVLPDEMIMIVFRKILDYLNYEFRPEYVRWLQRKNVDFKALRRAG